MMRGIAGLCLLGRCLACCRLCRASAFGLVAETTRTLESCMFRLVKLRPGVVAVQQPSLPPSAFMLPPASCLCPNLPYPSGAWGMELAGRECPHGTAGASGPGDVTPHPAIAVSIRPLGTSPLSSSLLLTGSMHRQQG